MVESIDVKFGGEKTRAAAVVGDEHGARRVQQLKFGFICPAQNELSRMSRVEQLND